MLLIALSLVCGLLPGFAWLVFYLGEETHAEPKRLIAFTFIVGMAFGFFTVGIENLWSGWAAGLNITALSFASLLVLALIEEAMKFAAAHFAVSRSPAMSDPVDAMLYMIVAALGFATLENIGAVAGLSPTGGALIPAIFEAISLRFVGATLLHTLTSGLVGYEWALGIMKGKVAEYVPVGIIVAAILHASFNELIIAFGGNAYVVIFLLLIGFFVLNDFEKLKAEHINLIPEQ